VFAEVSALNERFELFAAESEPTHEGVRIIEKMNATIKNRLVLSTP
jgi:hypothetical protein